MSSLTAEAAVAPPLPRRRRRRPGGGLSPWLFALPALAVYVVFLVYPSITSLFFSLTDWDGLSPTYNIVGLQNYVDMTKDPVIATALKNNVIWTVVTLTVPLVVGLALAILLNGKVRGKPILRLIFYTPAVLPLVAIASIWGWLYNPQYGAINEFLRVIGLGAAGPAVARSGLHRVGRRHGPRHLGAGRLSDAALLSRSAGHLHRDV